MIYRLLEDLQKHLSGKQSLSPDEQDMLGRVNRALPEMLGDGDTEFLHSDELLVRICPGTKRPVLVCHAGGGRCLCLHNGTAGEDMLDVNQWLLSHGQNGEGCRRLLETVADLAYNAGHDNLWENNDSRTVVTGIVGWAREFEQENGGTDWNTEDYVLAVDKFYRSKVDNLVVTRILFDARYKGLEYKDLDMGYHGEPGDEDVTYRHIHDGDGPWGMVNVGEDVLDFQIYGNPDIPRQLMMQACGMVREGDRYVHGSLLENGRDIEISNIRVSYKFG